VILGNTINEVYPKINDTTLIKQAALKFIEDFAAGQLDQNPAAVSYGDDLFSGKEEICL